MANIRVSTIGGHEYVTVRWLVRGGNRYTIVVDSKKGGTAEGVSTASIR